VVSQRFLTLPILSLYLATSALQNVNLVEHDETSDSFRYPHVIKTAILHSLSDSTLQARFDWAMFALNDRFPQTDRGQPLLAEWASCEVYRPHLDSLINVYQQVQDRLRPPILLAEIMRRCIW
jgi:hypothetical protein